MDTLNIIPLFDNNLKKSFNIFNPRNLVISNNDMKFNSASGLTDDHILSLYSMTRG